jgi:hypothetical protein
LVFVGHDRCSQGPYLPQPAPPITVEDYFSRAGNRSTTCKFVDMDELNESEAGRFFLQLCSHRLLDGRSSSVSTEDGDTKLTKTGGVVAKPKFANREQQQVYSDLMKINMGGNMFILSKFADAVADPGSQSYVMEGSMLIFSICHTIRIPQFVAEIGGLRSVSLTSEFLDVLATKRHEDSLKRIASIIFRSAKPGSSASAKTFTSQQLQHLLGNDLFKLALQSTCLRYHTESGQYSFSPYFSLLSASPNNLNSSPGAWHYFKTVFGLLIVSSATAVTMGALSGYMQAGNFWPFNDHGNNPPNNGNIRNNTRPGPGLDGHGLPVAVPIDNEAIHL